MLCWKPGFCLGMDTRITLGSLVHSTLGHVSPTWTKLRTASGQITLPTLGKSSNHRCDKKNSVGHAADTESSSATHFEGLVYAHSFRRGSRTLHRPTSYNLVMYATKYASQSEQHCIAQKASCRGRSTALGRCCVLRETFL